MARRETEIRSWDVPGAGALVIRREGFFLRLIETVSELNIDAWFRGGRVGRFVGVQQGAAFKQFQFDELHISGNAQTIKIAIGASEGVEVEDNRPTVNATVNSTVEPSDTPDTEADVTVGSAATLIASGDTDQKYLLIDIDDDQPGPIRIGSSAGVTAGQGAKVHPGTSLVLPHEGALYGVRVGSADVVVSVSRFKRP